MREKLYTSQKAELIFNIVIWATAALLTIGAIISVNAMVEYYNYGTCLQSTIPNIYRPSFIFIIIQSDEKEPELIIKEKEVPNVKESQIACRELPAPERSSFKSFMDAVAIRDRRTAQYRLKSKYTLDKDTGIYMVDDRYCVALGSYYATEIGTKVDVVLDSGNIIPCILADCKSDAHTDATHRQNPNGSVVEFIVRARSLSRKVRRMGDCSYAKEEWEGDVASIIVYNE